MSRRSLAIGPSPSLPRANDLVPCAHAAVIAGLAPARAAWLCAIDSDERAGGDNAVMAVLTRAGTQVLAAAAVAKGRRA